MPRYNVGPLTPLESRFVDEYLVDLNAFQAALRAGYKHTSKSRATGINVLKRPRVRAAVDAAMAARSERTKITADRVLQELERVATADIRKCMKWSGEHAEFIPSDELSDDSAAAIAGVEAETKYVTDKDGNSEKTVKLKMRFWDKPAALTQAGRHLGMFIDKTEHSGKVETGPPVLEIVVKRGDAT